jgi:hypothetical protein
MVGTKGEPPRKFFKAIGASEMCGGRSTERYAPVPERRRVTWTYRTSPVHRSVA